MIEMIGVSKWFGMFQVLKDVDLTVARGEKVVVCGPSGSGKSTLIRLVNRLEAHQAGRVIVDGVELDDDPKKDRPRAARSRHGVPELQPFPAPHGAREPDPRPGVGEARAAQGSRGNGNALPRAVRIPEQAGKYPSQLSAGSSSAWRSRARCACGRS